MPKVVYLYLFFRGGKNNEGCSNTQLTRENTQQIGELFTHTHTHTGETNMAHAAAEGLIAPSWGCRIASTLPAKSIPTHTREAIAQKAYK